MELFESVHIPLSSQRIASLHIINRHFISTYFIAWENSLHFVMPQLVSLWSDVSGMSIEIPYWWCITTYLWVVLLIGWKFASTNDKHYPDLGSDVLSFYFILFYWLCQMIRQVTPQKKVYIYSQYLTGWDTATMSTNNCGPKTQITKKCEN